MKLSSRVKLNKLSNQQRAALTLHNKSSNNNHRKTIQTKINHDFSPNILLVRDKIFNTLKFQSNLIVISLSTIGALIFYFLSDSSRFTPFESYRKASMVLHNVACGEGCATRMNSLSNLVL